MYLTYGVMATAIALMAVLVFKTEIIRDTSTQPQGQKPFSLAKTQMALWTLIIFCCFVYLWGQENMIISEKLKLERTALILLGIGAGAAVIGKTIDESDKKNLANGAIQSMNQNFPSEGFFRDILSDKDGISLLRFQNVIFSVVLMIGFVAYVAKFNKMPVFDDTLLILSGVSSAGYLGVKINENK
ncbi:MAG: hypothetical protein ACOYXT_19475 [Bacteroidota bacterium]